MIEIDFDSLSKEERALLGFLAFRERISENLLKSYSEKFGIFRDRVADMSRTFQNLGYLDGAVVPELLIPVIVNIIACNPEWGAAYSEITDQDMRSSWFWHLCLSFINGQLPLVPTGRVQKIPESPKFYRYYIPVFKNRDWHGMLSSLPDDLLIKMIKTTLDNGLENDDLTPELLDGLREAIILRFQDFRTSVCDELSSRVAFFKYLVTGNPGDITSRDDEWCAAYKAMHQLYIRNTRDAVRLFKNAYNMHCRGIVRFYIFNNAILSYLYVAALLKMNDEESDKTAVSLGERNCHYSEGASGVIRPMAVCGVMNSPGREEVAAQMLSKFIPETALGKQMKYLLGLWFGNSELPLDFDASDVHSAFMRHELSAYADIPAEERKELRRAFGGGPVLESIRRVAPWEQALMDAAESIPGDQPAAIAEEDRIVYNMSGTELKSIDLQSRTPDGRWLTIEKISQQNYINFSHPAMDNADKAVAVDLRVYQNERWSRYPTFRNEAEAVIPHMVGTGRVFCSAGQVEIRESAPSIKVKLKGDKIELKTNVSTDSYGNVLPCSVSGTCAAGFDVVRPDHRQAAVLRSLGKVPSYPIEAADTLRNVFAQIASFIEVDDKAMSAVDSAREENGSARLVATIGFDEKYSAYSLKIQACPLQGGRTRFEPASGGTEYIEKSGREHILVHRDFVGENTNFGMMKTFASKSLCNMKFLGGKGDRLMDSAAVLRLLEFLQANEDRFLAEWPKGHRIKYRGMGRTSVWEINGSAREEWFSIEGNIAFQGGSASVGDVLRYSQEDAPEGFIKLGEDEYAKISDQLRKQIDRLQSMGSVNGGELHVSRYQVGQLAKVLGQGRGTVSTGPEFNDLKSRMEAAYRTEPELPEGLLATLRPYQTEGYRWMKRLDAWGAGACLADDMGLGKTVQTIAFMLSKADEGPSLVVAPTSVVPNWATEIGRFAPGLRTVVLNHEKDRESVVKGAGPNDVIVSTYGVLAGNADLLKDREWNVICLDEAHQIKNRFTKVSQAAMDLRGQSRVVLTGTPVQNNLMELWNLFQFINPGLLGTCEQFRKKYISAMNEEDKETLDVLKGMTQPFILRRTKAEVLDDLPSKTEMDWLVRMTDEETRKYESMREYIEKQFSPENSNSRVDITMFESLTKLRLAACSMSLLEKSWNHESSKIRDVKFLLGNILRGDNKVLVFSQFTSFLGQVKGALDDLGADYLYLDGATTMKERQRLVDEFQTGETRVFLVSLKAGGLGLNLTAANYVLLMDPWWNPAIENQAKDRAHRIGQKRDVTVIRLISAHTIEEKILRLHDAKLGLSDNLLEGTANSSKLSYEDIVEMVSPF